MTASRETPDVATDLLDLGPVTAADVAAVERACARLLGTASDVLLMQAEAIVLLEAVAKSLARPGIRALNVVSGPYGALFGRWLTAAGADVTTLAVPFDRAVTTADVAKFLSRQSFDLVAIVHAEAATGSANPIGAIAETVAAAGAVLVVDAVASIGGHPVSPDAWPADIVVIGGQKALAGPAGVSAASISRRAWSMMEQNPGAPRESVLSLLDLRDGWLRSDRQSVLGTPSSLETAALGQAVRRVETEGLELVIGRHRAAAAAARAGVRALGLHPWISDDDAAATVVTTIAAPAGGAAVLLAGARSAGSRILTTAPGSLAGTALRINHTGRAAELSLVRNELIALGTALGRSSAEALTEAGQAWSARIGRRDSRNESESNRKYS